MHLSKRLQNGSWDSSVRIVTRLRAGRSGVLLSVGASDFCCLFQNFQADTGDLPTSYLLGSGPVLQGVKRPGREVDHPPHLAERPRMSGSVLLLPLYAFMPLDSETFAFTFCVCNIIGCGVRLVFVV